MKQAERNKTLDGQRIMFSVKISPPRKDLSLNILESLTSTEMNMLYLIFSNRFLKTLHM
jgi:hypothetical protein